MLFDLRGRGRRRAVQAIYLTLAILMGGGLVLFGIGGETSGGLIDGIIGEDDDEGQSQLEDDVEKAEDRTKRSPADAAAWAAVARLRTQLAGQETTEEGLVTEDGIGELRKAETAWDRYLALDPKKPDASLAQGMALAFSPTALNKPAKGVTAFEIVVEAEPTANNYAQLVQFAALAGQDRKAKLAKEKSLELSPKSERKERETALDQIIAQAGQIRTQQQGQPAPGG